MLSLRDYKALFYHILILSVIFIGWLPMMYLLLILGIYFWLVFPVSPLIILVMWSWVDYRKQKKGGD